MSNESEDSEEKDLTEEDLAKTIPNFEQTIVNFSTSDAPSSRKIVIIKPGYVFLDRYRVKDELGKGAMGVVYLCEDEVSGIDIALKAIPPEIGNDRIEMESVRENFQIVHKLHHPYIANVNTLERDAETGDYYLIMECVQGVNLWQYYKAKGFNPSLSMVMPILVQIASALDYAHGQEVIHRDIKPSNIQIMDDATVKILDYGLAQQIQTSMMRVTGHSYSKGGTPFFMAPEQWKGTHQDGTTDQYALAVVIYQVVSGKCPFQSTDMMVLREMVLHEKPRKPNELTDIEWRVLRKALEKERIARYKSCTELVEQLDKAINMTSSAPRQNFGAPNSGATQTGPSSKPFSHRDSRRASNRPNRQRRSRFQKAGKQQEKQASRNGGKGTIQKGHAGLSGPAPALRVGHSHYRRYCVQSSGKNVPSTRDGVRSAYGKGDGSGRRERLGSNRHSCKGGPSLRVGMRTNEEKNSSYYPIEQAAPEPDRPRNLRSRATSLYLLNGFHPGILPWVVFSMDIMMKSPLATS